MKTPATKQNACFEEQAKANSSSLEGRQRLSVDSSLVQITRRALDLLLALPLGILLLPLGALIALLIRLDSPGPVFFWQTRLGKGGKPFQILKFRSMQAGAETWLENALPGDPEARVSFSEFQKLRHDPRLTRLGGVLRRSSLDELPQLWNVIRGEMGLIGPRPILTTQRAAYGPAYSSYIRIRPGMTGLWQVSGRNMLSFADRARLDRVYLRDWSFWLDVSILARTVTAVLGRKGAF